ncbi:LysR family transcriptional regulator [Massilia eburnea]|uniref:LysR family transcriptional regulator n=1 Tax=Massilia eburnea TaxID=1776165 RepID=UPI003D6AB191
MNKFLTSRLAWNDYQVILAVARHGSLSKAAEALGSSHPTLFRRIRDIEASLGATLFERSRQGYQPTAAATELLAVAEEFDLRLRDLERDADLGVAGRLTLATTEVLMPRIVPPLLARCRRELPDITVNLQIGESLANVRQREADIALRSGGEPDGELIGRVICNIELAIYVPVGWPNVSEENLHQQAWVTVDESLGHLASSKWLEAEGLMRRAVARCSSTLAVCRLLEEGLGVGILPCHLGDANPRLRRVSPLLTDFRSQLWLLTPRQLRGIPKVSATVECLTAGLREMKDLFEGRGA